MTEWPKHYDPKESEPKWQKFWQENKIHEFDENDKGKEIYSVDTPPPTVSGKMHLGHAFSYAQQDFVVRYQRMLQKNVLYPFGTDDNGLPTERLVEKEKKIRAKDFSREEFRKICLDFVNQHKPTFTQDWINLGMSCDFDKSYSTIDKQAQRVAQKSFLDLYKKNLVSRTESPVAWCPTFQTAIAQAEFENIEKTSSFNDIAFHHGEEELIISTTRPELIPACVALFAHPDDDRYKHLKDKFATVPITEHEVPILFDQNVEKDKGTGLMMVCTFGDKEDIDKWHRYNLPLRTIIEKNGTLNKLAGPYQNLKIKEARKQIIEDLKEKGILKNQKQITHAVNVYERSKTEVEYLITRQWSVKLLDHKEQLLEAADKIKWYPEHMKVRYQHWVQNLNWDWCISRQRFYGVPFPVWYKQNGEIVLADESQLPVDPTIDKPNSTTEEVTPELDVMDTWNTSSLSPQLVLNWDEDEGMKNMFPMSMRPQAHDIIRTWAFYTIIKAQYHQDTIPWQDIVISGHVLDPKGRKMSKSLGNAISPQETIEKYSADALRFWSAGVKLGDDLPFMEKELVSAKKMIMKLWNASKFVTSHLEDYKGEKPSKLEVMDEWVLARLNEVIKESTEHFEKYEYSKSKLETEKFFWQVFCDNYLEICKARIYNPDIYGVEARLSAQYTLYHTLLAILKLIAPVMPHISEEIYQRFFKEHEKVVSIHKSSWPKEIELELEQAKEIGDATVKILSDVRKFKTEKQISLKTELSSIKITSPIELDGALEDLKAATKAQEILVTPGDLGVEVQE